MTLHVNLLIFSVPNTFETHLRITNMGWDLQLSDRNSDLFKLLSRELEGNLMAIFQSSPDLTVKLTEFRSRPSVLVTAVLRWRENLEAWSEERISERLVQTIKESNGRLHHKFRVDLSSVEVRQVVKNCRSLGCRRVDCEFSLSQLRFFCLCEAETLDKIDCVWRNQSLSLPGRAGPLTLIDHDRTMIDGKSDNLLNGAMTTELVHTTTEHSHTEEVTTSQTIRLDTTTTTSRDHSSTSTTTATTTTTSPATTLASTELGKYIFHLAVSSDPSSPFLVN